MSSPADAPPPAGIGPRVLVALLVGQVGMHSAMAGMRMAAALQALREGHGPATVGVLLALFSAAAVVLALHAGQLADRHGYHRPVALANGMTVAGALLAVASTFVEGWAHFGLLCAAAMLAGSGANMGMLTIQRTAGTQARDNAERVRVFSWLGVAPSFSNVIGPVAAGLLIDHAGFAAAYGLMVLLPLMSLWSLWQVPRRPVAPGAEGGQEVPAWTLLRAPGMKRLLLVSWVISAGWDVHAFAVPIVGHELQLSASTIGLILGTFTMAVTLVRLLMTRVAQHLREAAVIRVTMVGAAAVCVLYPFATSPWVMGGLSALLGVTLGASQPMVLATLHLLTPDGRHGQALALRSMAMNLSSTAMPMAFGVVGVALGAGVLFWLIGGALGAGAWLARRLPSPSAHAPG